jgi:2-iminobutanoate/2-iminopropanoate deaminase
MSGNTLRLINADELPAPAGHYSHAAVAGGMVYVSGLLPSTSEGKLLSSAPFEQQAGQVLRNLDAVLAASGSRRERLVQVRIYVADVENWGAFNRLYADWIGAHRPARCIVPVPALHYGVALEIEAVALAIAGS